MTQELIIFLLFAGALTYLGIILRRSFRSNEGCGKGCDCGPEGKTSVRSS